MRCTLQIAANLLFAFVRSPNTFPIKDNRNSAVGFLLSDHATFIYITSRTVIVICAALQIHAAGIHVRSTLS